MGIEEYRVGQPTVTAAQLSVAYAAFAPQLPGIVMPLALGDFICNATNAFTANRVTLCRAIAPITGVLHDLSIFVITQSGNLMASVYDTSATRARLWQSGSVACGAANAWQVIGDPALAVTAGQQIELGFSADNATAVFAIISQTPPGQFFQLPTSFWPAPLGAAPKLAAVNDPGSFIMPATIAEGSLSSNTKFPIIIGRIV